MVCVLSYICLLGFFFGGRMGKFVEISSGLIHFGGLPYWLSSKNPSANAGDAGSGSTSERSPGEGHGNPFINLLIINIPVFLPGKFHGQRSLVGYSPWGL